MNLFTFEKNPVILYKIGSFIMYWFNSRDASLRKVAIGNCKNNLQTTTRYSSTYACKVSIYSSIWFTRNESNARYYSQLNKGDMFGQIGG